MRRIWPRDSLVTNHIPFAAVATTTTKSTHAILPSRRGPRLGAPIFILHPRVGLLRAMRTPRSSSPSRAPASTLAAAGERLEGLAPHNGVQPVRGTPNERPAGGGSPPPTPGDSDARGPKPRR